MVSKVRSISGDTDLTWRSDATPPVPYMINLPIHVVNAGLRRLKQALQQGCVPGYAAELVT